MLKIFIKSIVTLILMTVLFSCENSITEVEQVTRQDSLPIVTAYDLVYERTDSGELQIILRSPKMERYEGENAYSVFPEGFEVTFYDTANNAVSFIRANYGISIDNKKIMRARNDVVVINYENDEQLNTENLVWDQNKKTINANTFIKITTPDEVIYGDSLHANESFRSRDIFNMRGVFEVEDDEDSVN